MFDPASQAAVGGWVTRLLRVAAWTALGFVIAFASVATALCWGAP